MQKKSFESEHAVLNDNVNDHVDFYTKWQF